MSPPIFTPVHSRQAHFGATLRALPTNVLISRTAFGVIIGVVSIIGAICFYFAVQWIGKPFPGFLINERLVNGSLGQYSWSGTRAGLKFPDKILRADGIALESAEDLDAIIQLHPVGTPIQYTVERKGTILDFDIPTMQFSLGDFIALPGLFFATGWLYFGLGIVVFIFKPDTKVSWCFFLLCSAIAILHICSFEVSSTHLGFLPLYRVNLALLPAAGIHLSLLFPEPRKIVQRYPRLQVVPYLVAALILLPIELLYPDPSFLPFAQLLFGYLLIGALFLVGTSLVSFIWQTSVIARQRALVVLFGAGLAFPLPTFGEVVMILGWTFWGIPVQVNFLTLPLVCFPVAIAYAISRHNLFDVDVYIKRTVGYVLMTALVGAVYFGFQTGIRTFLLDPVFGETAEHIYPILFALLIVFIFNPVNRAVQEMVDHVFFRKKFDYKETIKAVSNTLTTLLDTQAVIGTLIDTVRGQMFVDKVSVLVLHTQTEYLSLFSTGEGEGPAAHQNFCETRMAGRDSLVALVADKKRLITKYDVAESPEFAAVKTSCGARFTELGASLAIPLIHQNEVRGVLVVGYKKSGKFYSREDVQLLETLSNQGAVALENARMAEQMRKEETVRTNLARYLSPQIVDQIIEQDVQVNLGGDRKVVTILFSDIRNFTSITESRPPDQLVAILNEYFTEMAGIIFANKGSLDKYIGDAIVAVFGSLIPLENSALGAARASIQMMERMPVLNEKWMKKYHFGMDIGIGINTGEVFLGNIGSPERMEFTVIGDTVNVASRFSGLAKAGQILMTKETLASLNGSVSYTQLPSSEVKGKTGKLDVYEVVCQ